MNDLNDSTAATAAGGLVDETGVSLCIYGEDLAPEEISGALGLEPTHAHRRGEARSREGTWDAGAWIFSVRGEAPVSPEKLTLKLLSLLPEDAAVWRDLTQRFKVEIRFGIHFEGWNKGFHLSPAVIRGLANLGSEVGFDLYVTGDEDDA